MQEETELLKCEIEIHREVRERLNQNQKDFYLREQMRVIEEELGEICTVVATGGLSREIIAHCNHSIIYNENLLLDGLRLIYEKNN